MRRDKMTLQIIIRMFADSSIQLDILNLLFSSFFFPSGCTIALSAYISCTAQVGISFVHLQHWPFIALHIVTFLRSLASMTNNTQILFLVDKVEHQIKAVLASRTGPHTRDLQDFSDKLPKILEHVRESKCPPRDNPLLEKDSLGLAVRLQTADKDIFEQFAKDHMHQTSWGKQQNANLHWSILWATQVNIFSY